MEGKKMDKNKRNKILIIGVSIAVLIAVCLCCVVFNRDKDPKEKPVITDYSEFWQMVEDGKIRKVVYGSGELTRYVTAEEEKGYISNPRYDKFKKELLEAGVEVEEVAGKSTGWLVKILETAIYFAIFAWLFIGMKGGSENLKVKNVQKSTVTLDNVAGLEEVKDDIRTVIDFLANGKKYKDAGAKLPKGVLLYGPPGTGKTLLAKAIAGEAKAHFISVAGSDFANKYLGASADRVRALFKTARKYKPCIVFIDEIDAVGRSRDGGLDSEKQNTLNALLAEMDGFGTEDGIVVIAATNRLEDLDPALTRPGRFDSHFAVPLPATSDDRKAIIDLYAKNKKFDESVDLNTLAKETLGCSPADIEVILNESAIEAVRRGSQIISRDDIDTAYFKKVMKGHARKRSERDSEEIKLTAWHEAGHALIGVITGQEVTKVTIVPSTSGAGGVTMFNQEKLGMLSKEELLDRLKMMYGGRAAEELLVGEDKITTGASSDITSATNLISSMVYRFGMSDEFGLLDLEQCPVDNQYVLREMSDISRSAYRDALDMLREHRRILSKIADLLIEKETVSGSEVMAIYRNE